ncbi:MAG: cytochrome c oxidase assembly protein, partial [Natronospirillum sp.]
MHLTRAGCLILLVLFNWPSMALAHNPLAGDESGRWASGVAAAALCGFGCLYLLGSRVRPPGRLHAFGFHTTFLLAAVTLFGPLDDWAETSTAAHMVQHMLLMVVIAPLWVLSRPLPQLMSALRGHGAFFCRPLLVLTQRPDVAAYLHGVVIWFWHTPYFYTLAVEQPWWHVIEHACFLLTAGLFWWSVLRSSGRRRPWALLALLFTLM